MSWLVWADGAVARWRGRQNMELNFKNLFMLSWNSSASRYPAVLKCSAVLGTVRYILNLIPWVIDWPIKRRQDKKSFFKTQLRSRSDKRSDFCDLLLSLYRFVLAVSGATKQYQRIDENSNKSWLVVKRTGVSVIENWKRRATGFKTISTLSCN